MGEAIGKWKDYASAKFDVRVISGSTLPVNRWAYLAELKELMQAGVVDDIAVLAETDLKNKEQIIKRKSLYSQLQGQVQQLSEAVDDKDGTIETLERQLVQAGIKGKVMQAEVEINKKKEEVKSTLNKESTDIKGRGEVIKSVMQNEVDTRKKELAMEANNVKKDLQRNMKDK